MKRNFIQTIILCGALAFASCSTTNKMASAHRNVDDDVYYSNAQAGDQPEYRQPISDDERYTTYSGDDDDYYYYDSYESRINRFEYASPFSSYYDGYYYGYTPYGYSSGYDNGFYNGYYNSYSPYYAGFGYGYPYAGVGFGFGYPYGFGFGLGFGYPYYGYGYSPYSAWGIGYGGGYPYWGVYSASRSYANNGRPARVSYTPNGNSISVGRIGRNGASGVMFSPNRPSRVYGGANTISPGRAAASRFNNGTSYNPGNRTINTISRPVERPAFNPSSSSFGGGGRSGGGTGGGRPGRP
ncbi:hypothetical protein HH214_18740 [Mucilaginibacter robiniae]|uniref:Vitellogenin II n=1 Tax=Mucilaginibacter robiniae TaxID=2728022 RepID=A0A7L5EBI5_9SPHI|nr:hypothetical protein [Mucilaginibacter robiniae]QJD97766.1 hypothetical protein HH214_18740 [Mucilaginibacter robiniae]